MRLFSKVFILSISLFLAGCQKVIKVDLETADPKLVIDASIDWEKNSSGKEQKITLSKRTGYYDTEFPAVSGAKIFIKNTTGTVFDFPETSTKGEYKCTDFLPVIGETYSLAITLNGEIYMAVETITAAPEIDSIITQTSSGGMGGDAMEIRFTYQDDESSDNYYLSSKKTNYVAFPDYTLESDEMFQGNKMVEDYSDEKLLKSGDEVEIRLYGVSRRFFEYFKKILTAAGNDGSPWQVIPSAVRGNINNQSNEKNYPLGYFRLSQFSARNYTIK